MNLLKSLHTYNCLKMNVQTNHKRFFSNMHNTKYYNVHHRHHTFDQSNQHINETNEIEEKTEIETFFCSVIRGNKQWAEEYNKSSVESMDKSLLPQSPVSTALSCCDSRIPSTALGIASPNQVFSVRNLGNQVIASIIHPKHSKHTTNV